MNIPFVSPPTFDSIVSSLGRIIPKLEKLALRLASDIQENNEKVQKLEADNASKDSERTRALAVHENLKKLLGL
jgi:hypothetical protein